MLMVLSEAMEREELIKVLPSFSSYVEEQHASIVFKKFLSSCIAHHFPGLHSVKILIDEPALQLRMLWKNAKMNSFGSC